MTLTEFQKKILDSDLRGCKYVRSERLASQNVGTLFCGNRREEVHELMDPTPHSLFSLSLSALCVSVCARACVKVRKAKMLQTDTQCFDSTFTAHNDRKGAM